MTDANVIDMDVVKAMSIAQRENTMVLSAESRLESAKGRSKTASSALGPTLSLRGQGGAYDNIQRQPDNDVAASVAVNQNLYSGGANQARSRQGKLGVKQAEQSLADMKETVAQSVWNAFYDLLYRLEVVHTQNDALEYFTNAEKELTSGRSSNLDLTRVRQQKENARAQSYAAINNLGASRIELCRLLRLPPQTQFSLAGSLEDGLPSVEEASKLPDDPAGALKEVLAKRNDYQALITARDSKAQDITIAKAGLRPSLTLTSSYRFAYRSNGEPASQNPREPSTSNSDNQWIASLTLNVPVFDNGATSGRVRTAKGELEAAEQAVVEKEERVRSEIATNWLTLQNALASISASRASVKRAEESLKLAESGYRKRGNTQIDVLQARNDLTNALQQQAMVLKNARFAQGALWKAQGVFSEKAFRTPVQTVEVKPAGRKEKPSR
jgi:outer membrane protein